MSNRLLRAAVAFDRTVIVGCAEAAAAVISSTIIILAIRLIALLSLSSNPERNPLLLLEGSGSPKLLPLSKSQRLRIDLTMAG